MASVDTAELVERIWSRDATLWTGRDEAKWLGWLDEPKRMLERIGELEAFAADTAGFAHVVLLGMGGSSLAPEVLGRSFGGERLRVLDTTHPVAVRRVVGELDLASTLVVVASKSGTTLETRCHLDFFWDRIGRGEAFVAITDPGSELETLARERGFRAVFAGEPTIGGRYSALSVFGLAPAALLGVDLTRFLQRVEEMADACRLDAGNPGLELGEGLGHAWGEGRDKVVIDPNPGGFGLWAEQLLAESTGKQGRGLVPAPQESREGADRQVAEVRIPDPYELGQEFYRWEFATAVAGSVLEINPFDQPNVQEAKDRTNEILSGHSPVPGTGTGLEGSVEDLLAGAEPPEYVCIQAFIDPEREAELEPLVGRARETGCVVTHGLGPRYLHSTGQLHKGGPPTGRFVQVCDDPGEELPIPGRDFGFARLIEAQAAGDFAALEQRGRPIVRIRLEEIA